MRPMVPLLPLPPSLLLLLSPLLRVEASETSSFVVSSSSPHCTLPPSSPVPHMLSLRGGSGFMPVNNLQKDFQIACEYARTLNGVSVETRLLLYGFYKQATVGPCTGPEPSIFAWAERAKWQHWAALGNLTSTDAMKEYLKAMDGIEPKWRELASSQPVPQVEKLMTADHMSSSTDETTESEEEWISDEQEGEQRARFNFSSMWRLVLV
ncbi:acyl-CoA binding protein [Guillardia theta CCMP2712]|uniref:Acyl-CoA binding protein n=1 Tax=Guillardia theta (strain CCMP2712) TaxID=905079 RepID=L1IJF5_GUITC|nr:acyl-CoA binding protein [Guillardia theta CCMP2712]EKX36059.1 acyl-CoA binding protein [Guillardia theta CCMP2712]|eukprot:XP_005823039.1 acyl-CoA binding protein [Guillardia theta CCMP2712]